MFYRNYLVIAEISHCKNSGSAGKYFMMDIPMHYHWMHSVPIQSVEHSFLILKIGWCKACFFTLPHPCIYKTSPIINFYTPLVWSRRPVINSFNWNPDNRARRPPVMKYHVSWDVPKHMTTKVHQEPRFDFYDEV